MPIAAQSADGMLHQFPDGTDPSIVDRAMKNYAMQSAPQQSSGADTAADSAARGLPPMPLPKPSWGQAIQTTTAGRLGFGAMDLAHEGANLVEKGLGAVTGNPAIQADANQNVAAMGQREREYQMARKLSGQDGPDVARAVGNVGANVAAIPAGGATSLVGRGIQGAAAGGMSGALSPVTDQSEPYWDQKRKNVEWGAGLGLATPLAMEGAARVISPKASTNPDVQTLLEKGVRLTPGQMVGGATQRTEDKLTSLPILGDVITNAKQKSFQDLNRAAINDSLAPINDKLPANVNVGHDAVNYAYDKLGAAYDSITPHLSLDQNKLVTTLSSAGSQAATGQTLPEAETRQLANILKGQFSKLSGAQVDGETIKGIDSTLAMEARGYSKSQEWDKQKLGHAIEDVRSSLRSILAQDNPQYAPQLQKIDEGYAKYLRVERASRAAGKDGVFSPGQYDQAVKMMAGGARGSQAARGQALQQDLSSAGAKVLPSQYPNSGTPGRLLLDAGALGGLGYGAASTSAAPYAIPAALGLGAASLPYTGPGRKAAEYALARRPQSAQAMAQMLRGNSTPQLSGASSILARLLAQPSP